MVLLTDAPKQPQVSVPVDLTVELPAEFGIVTGIVTEAHSGEPIAGATVTLAATWNGGPLELTTVTDDEGGFPFVGPAGTWPATVALDGYVTLERDLTIVAGRTRGPVEVALHRDQPHAAVSPESLVFVLTRAAPAPPRSRSGTPRATSPWSSPSMITDQGPWRDGRETRPDDREPVRPDERVASGAASA